LEIIGIQRKQCLRLGFVDQAVHGRLPELIEQLAGLLHELRPEIVFTPAYEGGHPDHDSTAFAMGLAKKLHPHHFSHYEYRLYHAGAEGDWQTGEFLPHEEIRSEILAFSAEERILKARMAAAFHTQAEILARFPIDDERFRPAPEYDFTRPPHHGELLYEKFGWGISWADWEQKARQAHSQPVLNRMQDPQATEQRPQPIEP
jgi:LmbE family N-acetylglucosaminyl deacetylase